MAAAMALYRCRGFGPRKGFCFRSACVVSSRWPGGSVRSSSSEAVYDVVVSGGGMVGSAMAVALGRRQHSFFGT